MGSGYSKASSSQSKILEYASMDAKDFWKRKDDELIPLKNEIIKLIDTK